MEAKPSVEVLLERLAVVEQRLRPLRTPRDFWVELVVVLFLAPIGFSIDWRSTGALLFLTGLALALAMVRFFAFLARMPWRREHERLLAELDERGEGPSDDD